MALCGIFFLIPAYDDKGSIPLDLSRSFWKAYSSLRSRRPWRTRCSLEKTTTPAPERESRGGDRPAETVEEVWRTSPSVTTSASKDGEHDRKKGTPRRRVCGGVESATRKSSGEMLALGCVDRLVLLMYGGRCRWLVVRSTAAWAVVNSINYLFFFLLICLVLMPIEDICLVVRDLFTTNIESRLLLCLGLNVAFRFRIENKKKSDNSWMLVAGLGFKSIGLNVSYLPLFSC